MKNNSNMYLELKLRFISVLFTVLALYTTGVPKSWHANINIFDWYFQSFRNFAHQLFNFEIVNIDIITVFFYVYV